MYIYCKIHTGEQTFCSILCQNLGYKFFCLIDWINCRKDVFAERTPFLESQRSKVKNMSDLFGGLAPYFSVLRTNNSYLFLCVINQSRCGTGIIKTNKQSLTNCNLRRATELFEEILSITFNELTLKGYNFVIYDIVTWDTQIFNNDLFHRIWWICHCM